MEIKQHIILPINQWWDRDGNETPIRYQVMVATERNHSLDYKIGVIVSHLSPQDWCDLHGYLLIEVYRGSRKALAEEKTELF